MTNGNSSLIKIFCNNRYPSFPLLSKVTVLAASSKEELIKITAQQCLLLLVQLLNKKNVGRGYLAELQMVVFYHELTCDLNKKNKDLEGGLKYLVDLINSLRNNKISLTLLLNAVTNNAILPQIKNLPFVFYFIK